MPLWLVHFQHPWLLPTQPQKNGSHVSENSIHVKCKTLPKSCQADQLLITKTESRTNNNSHQEKEKKLKIYCWCRQGRGRLFQGQQLSTYLHLGHNLLDFFFQPKWSFTNQDITTHLHTNDLLIQSMWELQMDF